MLAEKHSIGAADLSPAASSSAHRQRCRWVHRGHHDDLYARAERGGFIHDAGTGFVGLIEPQSDGAGAVPSCRARAAPPERDIYDYWDDRSRR